MSFYTNNDPKTGRNCFSLNANLNDNPKTTKNCFGLNASFNADPKTARSCFSLSAWIDFTASVKLTDGLSSLLCARIYLAFLARYLSHPLVNSYVWKNNPSSFWFVRRCLFFMTPRSRKFSVEKLRLSVHRQYQLSALVTTISPWFASLVLITLWSEWCCINTLLSSLILQHADRR